MTSNLRRLRLGEQKKDKKKKKKPQEENKCPHLLRINIHKQYYNTVNVAVAAEHPNSKNTDTKCQRNTLVTVVFSQLTV